MSIDPRVDTYVRNAAPFAQPILTRLRTLVHAVVPGVEETIKWGLPHFESSGPFCHIAAFKRHATFHFWKSSLVARSGVSAEDAAALPGLARIASAADLPSDATLRRLIRAAADLNARGEKLPRRRTTKPPVRTPADLKTALDRQPRALVAYRALAPSHRREYVEWITSAKTEPTRQKRVLTAVEWIAAGKSRNWKYEKR